MGNFGKRALPAVLSAVGISIAAAGCGRGALVSTDVDTVEMKAETASAAVQWADLKPVGSMELLYADQFSVDYYENGYVLAAIP